MSELQVRTLVGEDWRAYRDMRLAALKDAPDAFASDYDAEVDFDEALWRAKIARSARLLAEQDGAAVGVVSVGLADEPEVAELFGMWVVPSSRGAGVAWRLTEEAAAHARRQGQRAIQAWVPVDSGRAVAFFSSYGFRPTDQRRAMTHDADAVELAMVFALGEDSGWVPVVRL